MITYFSLIVKRKDRNIYKMAESVKGPFYRPFDAFFFYSLTML